MGRRFDPDRAHFDVKVLSLVFKYIKRGFKFGKLFLFLAKNIFRLFSENEFRLEKTLILNEENLVISDKSDSQIVT